VDLHVEVSRLKEMELASTVSGESSQDIALRVEGAVERQRERFADGSVVYNGQLCHQQVQKICRVDDSSRMLLAKAATQLGLSARAYDRVLRISRTIADLSGEEEIQSAHVAEAIRYRTMFRSPVL